MHIHALYAEIARQRQTISANLTSACSNKASGCSCCALFIRLSYLYLAILGRYWYLVKLLHANELPNL